MTSQVKNDMTECFASYKTFGICQKNISANKLFEFITNQLNIVKVFFQNYIFKHVFVYLQLVNVMSLPCYALGKKKTFVHKLRRGEFHHCNV